MRGEKISTIEAEQKTKHTTIPRGKHYKSQEFTRGNIKTHTIFPRAKANISK